MHIPVYSLHDSLQSCSESARLGHPEEILLLKLLQIPNGLPEPVTQG